MAQITENHPQKVNSGKTAIWQFLKLYNEFYNFFFVVFLIGISEKQKMAIVHIPTDWNEISLYFMFSMFLSTCRVLLYLRIF